MGFSKFRVFGLCFVFGRRRHDDNDGGSCKHETSRELDFTSSEKLDSGSGGVKKRILSVLFLVLIAAAVLFEARSDTGGGERVEEPSAALTGQPAHSPSISLVATQFVNVFPSYSKELVENHPDSPRAKAFSWLQEDSLYNEYQIVYR
jgi:hypothetical protein